MEKEKSKTYVYSKKDYHFLFYLFLIIIGITGFIYILSQVYFFPVQTNTETESSNSEMYSYAAILLLIIVFIIMFLSYLLFRDIFGKRELKISDWGIENKKGDNLELSVSWQNISLIRSCNIGEKVISILKKDENKHHYIWYMNPKERIEAFKKMAEYARKYNIEIDDPLGYLNK